MFLEDKDFDIRELEERGFNAWPARHTTHVNGWLIRLTGGLTKRANSANCLAPSGSFAEVKRVAESIFTQQSLPTIFRITPLVPAGIDPLLEQDGYVVKDTCLVMAASQDVLPARASFDIVLRDTPGEEWCDGIARANAIPTHLRAVHDDIVASIHLPAAFATAYVDDAASGFAMAVADRGMVGIFDVIVRQSQRGRGIGRAVTAELLHWGKQQGSAIAYLQTVEANEVARNLYSRLGFREIYRYHYRCRP